MNKISLEIFENEAECISFEGDGSGGLIFELSEPLNALLSIDGIVKPLTDGRCTLDLRLLTDGEHEPHLLYAKRKIALPRLTKRASKIRLADCGADFIRRVSLRERRLAERVKELETKLIEVCDKVFGATIF